VDLPAVVKCYLDRLQPTIYITTEAELWPNIQSQCRERGIPVALVNARIYLHNKRGVRGMIVRRCMSCAIWWCARTSASAAVSSVLVSPRSGWSFPATPKFDFTLPEWDAAQVDASRARLDWALPR